ncbi:DNA protecting protein DprA [Subtercola boreus]|uniref:DNA protecting protein DprA n=1 Tax=Subtercola boreus TaxID=120213 RepID=A0A3E0VMJ5_9MICO|nr:DNA protecting protein DprA [Subtercola boreus]
MEAVAAVSPGWAPGEPEQAEGAGEAGAVGEAGAAEAAAERFARACWSGIAEPGDAVAGHLVSTLGAADALRCLVDRLPAASIIGLLQDAGGDAPNDAAVEAGLERWRPRLAASSALTALRQAHRCGARLVVPGDREWPAGFAGLGPHQPLALWVRGRPNAVLGLRSAIAIVGARAASGYGEHVAMELSAGLADRGFGVASGAAYGIDGMAHRSALASSGQTFAFLAGGVDRFYPTGHDALLARIAEVGVVLSELPCGSAPTKWRFLQRNRLIAAASLATVVVEAGVRSGSLNTAAHAAALGRPLGAVPGPVTSPSSAGCHRLLREFDAVCVTTAEEVVQLVAEPAPGQFQPELRGLPALEAPQRAGPRGDVAGPVGGRRRPAEHVRVLDAVSRRALRSAEEVAQRAGLSVGSAQAALGALGLEGVVEEKDGGWRAVPAG